MVHVTTKNMESRKYMVYVLSVAGGSGVGLESPLPVTITSLGLRKKLETWRIFFKFSESIRA